MHALLILTTVLSSIAPDTSPDPRSAPSTPEASERSRIEAPPSATPPGPSADRYHLTEAQQRQANNDNVRNRIVLEYLASTGMGLVGAGLGSVFMSSIAGISGGTQPALALVPLALIVLGNSAGATLVGSSMQGHGDFVYALLGSAIGLAVPIALAAATLPSCSGDLPCVGPLLLISLTVLVLPPLGAVIGYEASSARAPTSPGHASSSRPPAPRVVPVLAPAGHGLGATVGLAGIL